MFRFAALLSAALCATPSIGATYSDSLAFGADPLAAALIGEDFEAATRSDGVITFAGGTITCLAAAPVTFCPPTPSNLFNVPFFGLSRAADVGVVGLPDTVLSGVNAPYFAAPDSVRFSFAQAITAFGIFIGGLGDAGGATTLAGSLSTGVAFTVAENRVVPPPTLAGIVFTGNTLFFGITSATPFTTVTFTATGTDGDGIFFDDMVYATAVVPVPAPALLLLTALGALAVARRRRPA